MTRKPYLPFGKRIRELRLEKDLSQRDLAEQVKIDFTYLSKIENAKVDPPSDDAIRRLAHALDADIEELLALAAKVSQEDLRETVTDNPGLGVLFRKLQSGRLTPEQIDKMLQISKDDSGGDDPVGK